MNNVTREAQIFTVRINTDFDWTVVGQTTDELLESSPATGFEPADTIEAVVWGGQDSATVFTPTAEWINAPGAEARLSVTAAMTVALTPGVYPLEMTVIVNGTGQRVPFLDAWFEVTESPGVAAALPVYGTVQDLFDFGGGAWLPQLRFVPGLANFTRQRARARSRLDTLILKAYRPWTRYNGARNPYIDSGEGQSLEGYDKTMRGYLATNKLIVTDETREICALMALEQVCRQQFTFTADDPFPARAQYFKAQASRLIKCYRAEVDTNADGIAEFSFNLGVHSIR